VPAPTAQPRSGVSGGVGLPPPRKATFAALALEAHADADDAAGDDRLEASEWVKRRRRVPARPAASRAEGSGFGALPEVEVGLRAVVVVVEG